MFTGVVGHQTAGLTPDRTAGLCLNPGRNVGLPASVMGFRTDGLNHGRTVGLCVQV